MRCRALIVAAVLPLIMLLTGCGGGGPSAAELYEQMKTSTAAATSVRLVGTMKVDGKPTEIDLKGNRDGSNQIAIVKQGGGTATFLTVDGKEYMKADKAFFAAIGEGSTGDIIGDKYIDVTEGPALSDELNVGLLLDDLFAEEDAFNLSTKVEEGDLEGTKAYRVSDRVGSDGTEIWVSADGEAHLLKIVGPFEGEPMSLVFSEWNAVEPVTAPAPEDIMSM